MEKGINLLKMKKTLLFMLILCVNLAAAQTLRLELDPINLTLEKYFVFDDFEYYMSFTGGTIFNKDIVIKANYKDSSSSITNPTEYGLVNLENAHDILSIEVFNFSNFVYKKEINYCNSNGICEPCESEKCDISENALTCNDCSNIESDLLCNPVLDEICDPDCVYEDKDCVEKVFYSCEDASYITCNEREYCTDEMLYNEDLNELCCTGLCEEIIIEDSYSNLFFNKNKYKLNKKYIIITFVVILVLLGLYFVKKNKLITIFGILVLCTFIINISPFSENGNSITGKVVDETYSFNFVPLSSSIYNKVKISYDINFVMDHLIGTHPDAISLIEYQRTHLIPYQYLPNIEVPLPIVMGVIGTESGGWVYPISQQSQLGSCRYPVTCTCNSLGFCGLMQVNKEKCTIQNGCEWHKFLTGSPEELINNQVAPGIRYMAQMAAYLVKQGMDPDHPDIWYFAAMAYNGGLGRVMCGNSACDELDGTIIGNLMKLKSSSDINDISFNDLLDSLTYGESGLVDQGAFKNIRVSITNSGANQMISHALRTMAFSKEYMEKQGITIKEPNTQEVLQNIPEKIKTGEKIGYYYLNPSVSVVDKIDIKKLYNEIAFSSILIKETLECSDSNMKCILLILEKYEKSNPENDYIWNIDFCSGNVCGFTIKNSVMILNDESHIKFALTISESGIKEFSNFEYDIISLTNNQNKPQEIKSRSREIVSSNVGAQSSLSAQPWVPVNGQITNSIDDRDPDKYDQIIEQFQVETNIRYVKNQQGKDETYCNIFVWDVTRAMNAEIPHWVDLKGRPVGLLEGNELNANMVVDWLNNNGEIYGWIEISAQIAQEKANQGKPTVVVWKNPSGIGHVAVVRPGEITSEGPTIAQAGWYNFEYIHVHNKDSFANRDVKYYFHE